MIMLHTNDDKAMDTQMIQKALQIIQYDYGESVGVVSQPVSLDYDEESLSLILGKPDSYLDNDTPSNSMDVNVSSQNTPSDEEDCSVIGWGDHDYMLPDAEKKFIDKEKAAQPTIFGSDNTNDKPSTSSAVKMKQPTLRSLLDGKTYSKIKPPLTHSSSPATGYRQVEES